jgi:hypothetical protein
VLLLGEPDQHGDYPDEQAPGFDTLFDQVVCDHASDIEDGSTFGSGSLCDTIEAFLFVLFELFRPFGNVQYD